MDMALESNRAAARLGGAHDRDLQRPLGGWAGSRLPPCVDPERGDQAALHGQCVQVNPRKNFEVKLLCREGCELPVTEPARQPGVGGAG